MSSARNTRKSVKFRKRGRHAAPSKAEKIAGRAAKATPVIAIVGAIVTPQLQGTANAATTASAGHAASAVRTTHWTQAAKTVRATLDAVTTSDRTYQVHAGDTLSGIAAQFYGNPADWRWLYQQNTATVSNPNLIYPGQVIDVPYGAPSRSSRPESSDSSEGTAASTASSQTSQASQVSQTSQASQASQSSQVNTGGASTAGNSGALSGTLDCSGLESLWDAAGGNPADAFTAAEIAMAESSGNQYALSPTGDYGYWQINAAAHGSMATYNPMGNAEAAVSISSDGTNWTPWTTYNTGAYIGQC